MMITAMMHNKTYKNDLLMPLLYTQLNEPFYRQAQDGLLTGVVAYNLAIVPGQLGRYKHLPFDQSDAALRSRRLICSFVPFGLVNT
jgi:hypothetical protein